LNCILYLQFDYINWNDVFFSADSLILVSCWSGTGRSMASAELPLEYVFCLPWTCLSKGHCAVIFAAGKVKTPAGNPPWPV
jgi:hypothetical protein